MLQKALLPLHALWTCFSTGFLSSVLSATELTYALLSMTYLRITRSGRQTKKLKTDIVLVFINVTQPESRGSRLLLHDHPAACSLTTAFVSLPASREFTLNPIPVANKQTKNKTRKGQFVWFRAHCNLLCTEFPPALRTLNLLFFFRPFVSAWFCTISTLAF